MNSNRKRWQTNPLLFVPLRVKYFAYGLKCCHFKYRTGDMHKYLSKFKAIMYSITLSQNTKRFSTFARKPMFSYCRYKQKMQKKKWHLFGVVDNFLLEISHVNSSFWFCCHFSYCCCICSCDSVVPICHHA